MPPKTNLSTESQITRGIEQLVLGWQFISNPESQKKKIPIDLMINILEESYNDLSERQENETDYLDRRYRNYREKLGEKPFYIKIDLQKKIIKNLKGNEENIRRLAKIYLENYSEDYSDYILDNYLKVQKENRLLEYSLFVIVFFNLASRLGLTVEMTYDNILDSSKKRRRRIRPIGVSCRRPYLNLIAQDCNDKIYKHFVLSCITEIHTDIFEFANDSERKRTNLDLKYFRNSKDYRFGKEYIAYRIELKKKFLRHFRNVYFPEFEIIEESSDAVILEVTTWDYRYFYNAIFNYREHCLLLAPTDKVDFYKDILQNTLKKYSDD
ncbi:MAG: WYL domain-containing protein [Leptospiraceae bacterium]|nr:WYL domain-containing protein [Leptospiraceae bacterium]